jgi:hypothetical protein
MRERGSRPKPGNPHTLLRRASKRQRPLRGARALQAHR